MTLKYPKISIVTPNYNGAAFLEETIKSVLNQNYPNLEYIIIDGGSTDNSIDIIKKYDDNLSFWVSEPDNGLYDAIQKGFDKSTGEIMAWINSDDMYARGAFSMVSEIFSNFKQVSWLQGLPSTYDEQGRVVNISPLKRWSKYNYYTGDFKWIQQESIFWRRELWEKSGSKLATELKYAGDFELWLRFFRTEKLFCIKALLGGFRVRSKNQLSLDYLDDYINEVDELIANEITNTISMQEQIIVKELVYYEQKLLSKFWLTRFFCNRKLKKIRKKHYNYPPTIYFNRVDQTFLIN